MVYNDVRSFLGVHGHWQPSTSSTWNTFRMFFRMLFFRLFWMGDRKVVVVLDWNVISKTVIITETLPWTPCLTSDMWSSHISHFLSCPVLVTTIGNNLCLEMHSRLKSFLFCKSFPFLLLQDWLHGFPRLLTDTTELIRFYFLVFLFSTFLLLVPYSRLSWLTSAFEHTLK